jgi:membrane protein
MSDRSSSGDSEKRPSLFSKGWWVMIGLLIKQSVVDFIEDNGPQWAAAVSYYALLSAFPLMLAIITIGMTFLPQEAIISMLTEVLGDFIPEGEDELEAIIEGAMAARTGVGAFSILLLLWSGSRVFGVVTRALNIFYDVDEAYGFVKKTLIEILMLLSIGLLFVVALASRWILETFLLELDIFSHNLVSQAVTVLVPFGLLLVSLFFMYRFVPRRTVNWKAALAGAVVATTAFTIARPLFWYYVQEFAAYELVYGPIAVVAILIFWGWLVSLFVLFGGELVGHIEDMIIEGKTPEEVRKRHMARSPFYSHRQQAEKTGEDEEFKALERFAGLAKPEGLRGQMRWGLTGRYRTDLVGNPENPAAERGIRWVGGLTLAALSSVFLLLFNAWRKR